MAGIDAHLVEVEGDIHGLHAEVVITQTYTNNEPCAVDTMFKFPIHSYQALGTIAGVEVRIEGAVVQASVAEKTQAQEAFRQATAEPLQDVLAPGFGDGDGGDTLVCSIFNLKAGQSVSICFRFVCSLLPETDDSLRFILPTSFIPMQTAVPDADDDSASGDPMWHLSQGTRSMELNPQPYHLRLRLDVVCPFSEIIDIVSPTHEDVMTVDWDDECALVGCEQDICNDEDFVLLLHLDRARVNQAAIEVDPETKGRCVTAIMYPEIKPASSPKRCEVVLLVDNSTPDNRKAPFFEPAVTAMLECIQKSCIFNVVTCGNMVRSCFDVSTKRTMRSRQLAKTHVREAVPGLHEIEEAFRQIYSKPVAADCDRIILLVSDGQIPTVGSLLRFLQSAECQKQACRVFVLAVAAPNHQCVHSIASVTHGAVEYVDRPSMMKEKLTRQLKRAQLHSACMPSLDWGNLTDALCVGKYPGSDRMASHGDAYVMHALVQPAWKRPTDIGMTIPEDSWDDSGDIGPSMYFPLDPRDPDTRQGEVAHIIAAKAMVHALEREFDRTGEAEVRTRLLRLAKAYSIVSRHSSFCAHELMVEDDPSSPFVAILSLSGFLDLPPMSPGWRSPYVRVRERNTDAPSSPSGITNPKNDQKRWATSSSPPLSLGDNFEVLHRKDTERSSSNGNHKDRVYGLDFLMKFKAMVTGAPKGVSADAMDLCALTQEPLPASAQRGRRSRGGSTQSRKSKSRANAIFAGSPNRSLSGSRLGANRSRPGTYSLNPSPANSPQRSPRRSLNPSPDRSPRYTTFSPLASPKPRRVRPSSGPLDRRSNAWVPSGTLPRGARDDEEDMIAEMRGIVNKISKPNFEKLLRRIESIGFPTIDVMKRLIDFIFNKAIIEHGFSPVYAELCWRLSVTAPIFGKKLSFRRLLLNRCQVEFEKPFTLSEAERQGKSKDEITGLEIKLRVRNIGNMKFTGELFKKGMLTKNIMKRCILRLLADPDDEALLTLCQLLKTTGSMLEESSRPFVDQTFDQLQGLIDGNVKMRDGTCAPPRVRFELMDTMDFRKRGWRDANAKNPSLQRTNPFSVPKRKAGQRRGNSHHILAPMRRSSAAVISTRKKSDWDFGVVERGDGWDKPLFASGDMRSPSPQRKAHASGSRSAIGRSGRARRLDFSSLRMPRRNSDSHGARKPVSLLQSVADLREGSGGPSPKSASAPPPSADMSLDQVTHEVDMSLKEYLTTWDDDEAVACLEQLPKTIAGECIVSACIVLCYDKAEREVKLMLKLFRTLITGGIVSVSDLQVAVAKIIVELADWLADAPNAGFVAGQFIAVAVEEGRLDLSFVVANLLSHADLPRTGALRVVVSVLSFLCASQRMGEDEVQQAWARLGGATAARFVPRDAKATAVAQVMEGVTQAKAAVKRILVQQ